MKIPVNINLEVEGHGSITACTVDIDTAKPLAGQIITALNGIDPRDLEFALYPKRYVIGTADTA